MTPRLPFAASTSSASLPAECPLLRIASVTGHRNHELLVRGIASKIGTRAASAKAACEDMSSGGGEAAAVSVIVVAVAAADYMQSLVYNRRRRAEAEQGPSSPPAQGADAGASDAAAPGPLAQTLPQKAKEVLLGYFDISPAELASLTG